MLLYGIGGVGKSTFASTAPKPVMADIENGSKYFGLRGISMDVAQIKTWKDIQEFYLIVKDSGYETIVVDPIGELMEKLKAHMIATGDKKLVMGDGSPTMAGWGWMKDSMRNFVKAVRDTGKHLLIITHVEEKDDEGRLVKRPRIMTKIADELIAMVDIVGYMDVVTVEGEAKRIIRVQPGDRYEAKDRTDMLGPIIEPDFTKIVKACQGTETYKWSKSKTPQNSPKTAPKTKVKAKKADNPAPTKKDALKAKLAKK